MKEVKLLIQLQEKFEDSIG